MKRGSVVIEGSGWEPTITTTGLGTSSNPRRRHGDVGEVDDDVSGQAKRAQVNDVMGHVKEGQTGERAGLVNIVIRHRNELQSCSVYIPIGEPAFINCDIQGGIRVAGGKSRPLITNCSIIESRSPGISFTDHAMGTITSSSIANCRGPAIQIDRFACPWISCKIDVATVESPALQLSTTARPQALLCQQWDHEREMSTSSSLAPNLISSSGANGYQESGVDSRIVRCFLDRCSIEDVSLRIVVIEQLPFFNNTGDDESIMHGDGVEEAVIAALDDDCDE